MDQRGLSMAQLSRSIWVRSFFYSSMLALIVAATAKIISAFQPLRILNSPDPVLGFITRRQMLLLSGYLEIVIVVSMSWRASIAFSAAALAWLTSLFLGYRICLHFLAPTEPCSCLGSLSAWMHMSDAGLQVVTNGLFLYLLIGSYWIYFGWLPLTRRRIGSATLEPPVRDV
jgi:hypothetical protein